MKKWAHSNEAVCSNESCLAMAHSSELLQVPACQKPLIVPDSPAGLRAMNHGAKIPSFSQMKLTLTSSSLVSRPPSLNIPIDQVLLFSWVQSHGTQSSIIILNQRSHPPKSHFLLFHMNRFPIAQAFAFMWPTMQCEGWRKSRKFSSKVNTSIVSATW